MRGRRALLAAAVLAAAAVAGWETDRRLWGWAYDRALEAQLPKDTPAAGREAVAARARTAPVIVVDVSIASSAGEAIAARGELARLVDRLAAAGAQAIGFDVRFDGPGAPGDDAALAAAIERAGNVVVAALKEPGTDTVLHSHFGRQAAAEGLVNLVVDSRDGYLRHVAHLMGSGKNSKELLPSLSLTMACRLASLPGERGTGAVPPSSTDAARLQGEPARPAAASGERGTGAVPPSPTDAARLQGEPARPAAASGERGTGAVPPSPTDAARLQGEPPAPWRVTGSGIEIEGSRRRIWIPVDEDGRSLLLYRGPAGTIPILRPEWLEGLDLGGKAVLVGNARTDIRDSYLTPFGRDASGRLSGVEVQAQELAGLMEGAAWRMPGRSRSPLAPAAAAAMGIAAAWFLPPAAAAALALVSSAIVFELSLWAFGATGLLVVPYGPAFALVAACAGWTLVRYGELSRSRRGLQALLTTYFRAEPSEAPATEQVRSDRTMARLMEAKELLAPSGIEVLGPLGSGGMSFVFKARVRRTGQLVALKLLSPDLFRDADGRVRFGHEARLASALEHPNVVSVVSAGDETGVPYIAYELIDGPSLRQLLTGRGPLPAGEAVRLTRQVLAGLAAAHARQIVHRDIKPDNVLVDRDGQARIVDFGIARSDSLRDGFHTRTGMLLGTPTYMAPELMRDVEASPRSDLYSAACMLYELLSGAPPFVAESASAVLIAHLEKAPVPLPDLPEGLWAILEMALAKDPRKRPLSAEEFSARLAPFETAAGDEGLGAREAPRPSATVRVARPIERAGATVRVKREE